MKKNTDIVKQNMRYRYLGNSGLKVSVIGYGNWLNSNNPDNYEITKNAIKACFEMGVNFFDTAEIYGAGEAERQMGKAFKELNLRREDLVVSTKIFKCGDGVNDNFMSRKHIIEGLKNSLKRLQLDYVDVVFSHRPDLNSSIEETCKAFSWCIDKGLAFYWGTSEWPVDRIIAALEFCEKHNLHKPIVEQPQYNMFVRQRFEHEYRFLFEKYNYGSTIWSPLCQGILTGKYNDGQKPEATRFAAQDQDTQKRWNNFFGEQKRSETIKKLNALKDLAQSVGCSQAQLALAWTLANTDVSVALVGFTSIQQVDENLKALEILSKWNFHLEKQCKDILINDPDTEIDFSNWKNRTLRRDEMLLISQNN